MGYLSSGDIGNMHSYPNLGNPPTEDIDRYFIYHARAIVGEGKPLMSSETGYHNLTSHVMGIPERIGAKYIPRLLFENFNRDIKRMYLYQLIDEWPDPNNSDYQKHWGLLRNDGSPKPAFIAVKHLIAILNEPGANFNPGSLDYTLSGDTRDVHHTLLQKSNGEFYLVLWQEVKSWNNENKSDMYVPDRQVTLNLNTQINRAVAYDPVQSSSNPSWEVTNPNGGRISQLAVSVPDQPLIIKLTP